MTRTQAQWWATSVLFVSGLGRRDAAAAEIMLNLSPRVTVCVTSDAQVDPSSVEGAVVTASDILKKAGIETVWLPGHSETTGEELVCWQPNATNQIRLRIFRLRNAATVFSRSTEAVALRTTPDGGRGLVSVFYDRVESTAFETTTPITPLLGLLVAHEIGHLLLPPGHSPSGVMRGSLSLADVIRAGQGALRFTARQSEQMREGVLARAAQASAIAAVDRQSAGTPPR